MDETDGQEGEAMKEKTTLGDLMGDAADELKKRVKKAEEEAARSEKARRENWKRKMGRTIKYERKS